MSVTRTTNALLPFAADCVVPLVVLLELLLEEPPQPASSAAAAIRSPNLHAFMCWSMPMLRFLAALVAAPPICPSNWAAIGRRGSFQWSGPKPLSEPETRYAVALIRALHPAVTVWFHQHEDRVRAWGRRGPPRGGSRRCSAGCCRTATSGGR